MQVNWGSLETRAFFRAVPIGVGSAMRRAANLDFATLAGARAVAYSGARFAG